MYVERPLPGCDSSWMYIATLHCGYADASPCGLITGRSIPSCSTTTRVATRSGSGLDDGPLEAGGDASIGGRLGSARPVDGPAETISGIAEASGSAAAPLPE